MRFREWLESVISQTQIRKGPDWASILPALGIQSNVAPMRVNRGTFAFIYQHPLDPTKLIKITKDPMDARNLELAQRLKSPNVVNVYAKSPVGKAKAFVVDKVQGSPLPYGNDAMNVLIGGDMMMDSPAMAARKILQPTGKRLQILNQMNRNSPMELKKLSDLFTTLAKLEKLGIDINDFTDNILDVGDRFILIDLGQ